MKYEMQFYLIIEKPRSKDEPINYYTKTYGFVKDFKKMSLSDLYTSKEAAKLIIACGSLQYVDIVSAVLKIST